jgi:hypothetical protein
MGYVIGTVVIAAVLFGAGVFVGYRYRAKLSAVSQVADELGGISQAK